MKNKLLFVFAFVTTVVLHSYILNTTIPPHPMIVVNPQEKVSPIINLQHVAIKEPIIEPIVEKILPEPPKPVVEEVIIPLPPKIKKKIIKTPKKKVVKKKKKVKKTKKKVVKKKRKKVAKHASKALRSSPKIKAIKKNYLAKVRSIIEQRKTYPRSAKRMKQEGVVKIQFTIGKNGVIRHIRLKGKCPYSRLNKAAITILKKIITFPPIPDTLGKSYLSLTVPIKYKILD